MNSNASHDNQLQTGDAFSDLHLTGIDGAAITVPSGDGRLTHVQFRRFAGCPICNLHLRSITARITEIEPGGV